MGPEGFEPPSSAFSVLFDYYLSLAAWIYPTQTGAGYTEVIDKSTKSDAAPFSQYSMAYAYMYGSNLRQDAQFAGRTGNVHVTINTVPINQWNYIVITYEGKIQKQAKIYLNGQLNNTYDKLRYVSTPREYFKGLAMVIWHTERGHNSFLLGETSGVGWWYYFPVLLALKTPIPTLILFLLGIIFALKDKMQFKRNLFFLSAGLLFLLFAMTSKANLGLRHVMPITPVLFVMSGILASIKIKYIKYITGAAIVWLAAIYLFSYPFYISYYNELAGGTKNGYKVALDSNLDWGQDLLRVRNYLMERGINDAFIDYAWDGELALDYYNIPRSATTVLDDSFRGYAVISATSLQLNTYEWLRDNYNPVDRVTPSVFVFKI